jgi:hypothetical protein
MLKHAHIALREDDINSIAKSEKIKTKLGWFRGTDGKIRWGVKVVGGVGKGTVDWVEGLDGIDREALVREKTARRKTSKRRSEWLSDVRARFGL